MIKKVAVERLRPGMFIHDVNCGWTRHPFFVGKFLIKDDAVRAKLEEVGVGEVYIDTEKGDDALDARPKAEADKEALAKVESALAASPAVSPRIALRQEMTQARRIQAEAAQLVQGVMRDVRSGKHVAMERVKPVVEKMAESIFRNKDALLILGRIKQKDEYTFQHSVSVSTLIMSFMRSLELEDTLIRQAGVGGFLHDIGKMRISDTILNKPGPLTSEELETMKTHVTLGLELLEQATSIPAAALLVVSEHHERHDGTGYPRGLKSDEVSQIGQISAIIDVYDAITSDRLYRKRMEPNQALRKLFEWSEHHFNRELVERFIRTVGIYPVGTLVALESGFLGVVVEQSSEDLLRPIVCIVYNKKFGVTAGPRFLDLSKSEGQADRVIAVESPRKWGIDTNRYIETPVA